MGSLEDYKITGMVFSEERLNKLLKLVSKRQDGLTIILENVHDPHNIGAIMRSCDGAGVYEIYIVYNHPNKKEVEDFIGKSASSGAFKWVKVHFFDDIESCYKEVRKKYDKIYVTHLGESAKSLHNIDLTQKIALVFGNEHAGLSKLAIDKADGNFIIPMFGMIQSLNISVACAVSLFEASRQRALSGLYDLDFEPDNLFMLDRLKDYLKIERKRMYEQDPKVIEKITSDIIEYVKKN